MSHSHISSSTFGSLFSSSFRNVCQAHTSRLALFHLWKMISMYGVVNTSWLPFLPEMFCFSDLAALFLLFYRKDVQFG